MLFSNHMSPSLLTEEKKKTHFCLSENMCLVIAWQLQGRKAEMWVCCQQAEDFDEETDDLIAL